LYLHHITTKNNNYEDDEQLIIMTTISFHSTVFENVAQYFLEKHNHVDACSNSTLMK
jgi:hypothetical protein